MGWSDSGLAFLRGVGEGSTAGLVHYPASWAMMALDKTIGEGKMSQKDALALLKEQRKSDIENHAVANIGGQVAGAVVPAGTALKVLGKGWKTLAGIGAAQGAAQGFSQNAADEGTTLQDMGVGGALGGGLSFLGTGVTKVLGAGGRKEAFHGVLKQITETAGFGKTADAALKAKGVPVGKNGRYTQAQRKQVAAELAEDMLDNTHPADWGQFVQMPKANMAELAKDAVSRGVSGVVPAAVAGGVLGGAGALVSGNDPLTGAGVGAAGAVALAKQQAAGNLYQTGKAALGRQMARSPNVMAAPAVAGTMGGNVVAPALTVTKQRDPEPQVQPVDDFADLEQYRVKPTQKDDFSDLEQYRVK